MIIERWANQYLIIFLNFLLHGFSSTGENLLVKILEIRLFWVNSKGLDLIHPALFQNKRAILEFHSVCFKIISSSTCKEECFLYHSLHFFVTPNHNDSTYPNLSQQGWYIPFCFRFLWSRQPDLGATN